MVEVEKIRSMAQAEEACRQTFPNLEKCSFKGCAFSLIKPSVLQLAKLAREYPEVAGSLQTIISSRFSDKHNPRPIPEEEQQACIEFLHQTSEQAASCEDAIAYAWRYPPRLDLNTRFYGYAPYFWYANSIAGKNDTRPRKTPESVMTHEFAHLLMFWLQQRNEFIYLQGQTGRAQDVFDSWLYSQVSSTGMSEASRLTHHEFFAEALVSYYHSPDPCPAAVEVYQYAQAILKEIRCAKPCRPDLTVVAEDGTVIQLPAIQDAAEVEGDQSSRPLV